MWRICSSSCLDRLVCTGTIVVVFIVLFAGCQSRTALNGPQRKTANPVSVRLDQMQERTFTIEPGKEDEAFAYYKTTFDELGLNPQGLSGQPLVDSQNLSQALEFLGYKDLTPRGAEELSSVELMQRFPDNLLSSAFFAPKITDVSISPINVGWRKVLRFKAQGDAAKKGIATAFLLFNKFQGAGQFDVDPFKPPVNTSTESKNTQLILVRADGSALKQPLYFLVYGSLLEDNSKLITFLTASFDARAPNIVQNNKYYVPTACAECHGGLRFNGGDLEPDYERLKLNYLDTDHWFDRLDDDFAFLKGYSNGVLHDGGADEAKPEFAAAFDIVRRLNREIQTQNKSTEVPTPSPTPEDASIQLRAVTKWLDLHNTNSHHQNVFDRALPSITGDPWKANQLPDQELLPLMNQYCFRCHSSVRFSVFDRPNVVIRKKKILKFMDLPVCDPLSMPQDRNLNCSAKTLADKQKILQLVCALDAKPCPTPAPTPPCPSPSPCPTTSPQ